MVEQLAEFIRKEVLTPRLKKQGCLVVYDADGRYKELCRSLNSGSVRLVDASESSIESRDAAIHALADLGNPKTKLEGLVVYIPTNKPLTDEQKQADPFSIYTECGGVFPEDDGDEFVNLCLKAKPDFATEIRRIFAENPFPSFGVIDAIGHGSQWPQLRATLKVDSARDILLSLMAPTDAQIQAVKSQEGWASEARELLRSTLSMSVKTRAKSLSALSEELWRFVLFSEFVFDLPEPLPESLNGVPRAADDARPLILDLCDELRARPRTKDLYIEKAQAIESELRLPELCQSIQDFGQKDTFPFEEQTFLRQAIHGLVSDDSDKARQLLSRQEFSVWRNRGDSQERWTVIGAALELIEKCDDLDNQLPDHLSTQTSLLDFYVTNLREADRCQREFEQALGDFVDATGLFEPAIRRARRRYGDLTEKVQVVFTRQLEAFGWSPSGRLSNSNVFDRFVAGTLKDRGQKTAYFMIDALRYELGVTLHKLIADDGPVDLHVAFAQLPTITPVGMASLLPGAQSDLSLELIDDELVPTLAGTPMPTLVQRMGFLRKRFGDRFSEMTLRDFVRKKINIPETVDLLILRSTEIDSVLENNPEISLGLIPKTLKDIRVALHKLRELGFRNAVIAADHGFFLNAQAEAGDVCAKPQGKWTNVHDRMMLGDGVADANNFMLSAEKLGIRGTCSKVAGPRSMAPYSAGYLYFHGGISLQEAVVPVLVVRLEKEVPEDRTQFEVILTYKQGAKRITTFLPVFEISLRSKNLFEQHASVEILLEAQDSKGNVVGEPRPGREVNPATRTLTLVPGERGPVVFRMDPDFRGKFSVKALNPNTLATYAQLSLETDYTE
jgi:hypothetical protein